MILILLLSSTQFFSVYILPYAASDQSGNNSGFFVKYTLDLQNNTLFPGNVPLVAAGHHDGIAFDPANGYLYVADGGSDLMSVIDGANNKLVTSISIPQSFCDGPTDPTYDPSNGYLYVSCPDSNSIVVLNGVTNAIVANVTTGKSAYALAYDSQNNSLYVINLDGSYSIINGSTNTLLKSVAVPTAQSDVCACIAYDSSNGYLYIANDSGSVLVIDTGSNSLVGNIPSVKI